MITLIFLLYHNSITINFSVQPLSHYYDHFRLSHTRQLSIIIIRGQLEDSSYATLVPQYTFSWYFIIIVLHLILCIYTCKILLNKLICHLSNTTFLKLHLKKYVLRIPEVCNDYVNDKNCMQYISLCF